MIIVDIFSIFMRYPVFRDSMKMFLAQVLHEVELTITFFDNTLFQKKINCWHFPQNSCFDFFHTFVDPDLSLYSFLAWSIGNIENFDSFSTVLVIWRIFSCPKKIRDCILTFWPRRCCQLDFPVKVLDNGRWSESEFFQLYQGIKHF